MTSKWPARIVAGLLMLAVCALVIARITFKPLSHDEHQFIVPGILTATHGLVPYRDYPLFHTPYHALLTGWFAHFFEHQFLAGRLLSGVCIILSVWLLGWEIHRMFRGRNPWLQTAVLPALGVMLVFSPIFSFTANLLWNHGAPLLFVVAAFSAHLRAAERKAAPGWLLASGLLVGISAGMRISFLPLFAPFGLAVLLMQTADMRRRLTGLLWFGAGGLVALLPMLWLLAEFPEQFLFGNFQYPKLSLAWRKYKFWAENIRGHVDPQLGFLGDRTVAFQGRTLGRKLEEFWNQVILVNPSIYLCFLLVGLPVTVWRIIRSRAGEFAPVLLLLALPFLWWGSVAPSRFNLQYCYALLPFLVWLTAFGFAHLPKVAWLRIPASALLACGAAFTLWEGASDYRMVADLAHPSRWRAVTYDESLTPAREHVTGGKILTLEPMLALEAGFDVYPEFATGEFAWRSSHLLPADKRRRMKLVCPSDLEEFLAGDPPAGVLIEKYDKELNSPLRDHAVRHGFRKVIDTDKIEFWAAPATP